MCHAHKRNATQVTKICIHGRKEGMNNGNQRGRDCYTTKALNIKYMQGLVVVELHVIRIHDNS